MTLELSCSVGDMDTVQALLTGDVEPRGIDLTTVGEYPPRRHRRFFRNGEFDVCEVCLASYVSSVAAGDEFPYTAIPVFPNRKFRLAFFYKNADAGIEEPKDLEGKKVGTQSWQTTADVWVRGIAQEQYGLDLTEVEWYRRREDDVPVELPERFDIQRVPGKQAGDAIYEPRDMQGMLFSGELDAAMDPSGSLFRAVCRNDDAEFMFEDPKSEEIDFFEKTGMHPPMHTVAIRDEVLESDPWVAVSIYDAFSEALDRCIERNVSPSSHTSLTWNHLHYKEQHELLGEDAWEYGLRPKTKTELRTFVDYAVDQGLIPRAYDIEELFFETTLDL